MTQRDRMIASPGYIPSSELAEKMAALKAEGKTVVFTNGCFDILHVGHVRYLAEARALGGENGVLVVGINSDESVKALKSPPRPYVPEHERAEIIASLRAVDYVAIFDELNPIEIIKLVRPDIHVKGADYTPETLWERDTVIECGGRIEFIQLTKGLSTTNIVSKIKNVGDGSGK